ncbi:carbohydrate-binding module family 21 protein [Backusella circina FSU 941]|nr:carbohydrate-binding module family 21 protein [Backusella circina FSU 941]
MNPMLTQFRKRVQLQRAVKPVLPPPVKQQQSVKKNNNKKSVRFHQDDQVRYFLKCQSPNAVSQGDPPQDAVSANDFDLKLPNWPNRRSIYLNNANSKIRMESLVLTEADDLKENKILLEGRCRALNISYEKVVSVRYTFDLWSTFEETEAVYRDSIPSYGGRSSSWDRFSFYIPVTAANKNTTVYIALKYSVDNAEYWDNNDGSNYQADVSPKYPVTTPAEEIETEDGQVAAAVEEKEQELVNTLNELNLNVDTIGNKNTTEKLPLKVLGRRYDFTASLNAVRKPITSSPPLSPPGTPTDAEPLPYTPPVFFGGSSYMSHYASTVEKALSPPAFDTFPSIPVTIPSSVNKRQETIAIHDPVNEAPMEGYQMSYSDFVNKYCFYNSHSNPLYNNVYSTSPSAVLS